MSKWLKRLLGLAAVGSAIAGLIYYLKDDDFDLDNDLKPVTDREYVPLGGTPKETEETAEEETKEEESNSEEEDSED